MTASARSAIGVALVPVAAALLLYTSNLDQSPPYLMHDELQFSLQARSIAETGRDLSGRRFPLYFTEPEFPAGRDPVIIYTTAAALQMLPFSEYGVKLPTALAGVLNVALMIAAGRWIFGSYWLGALAGALLMLTPIHFIRSRLVLSPIYSLPFVLGWLIAFAIYVRTGSRRALLVSAAAISASVYTYLACVVMAPIYFAIAMAVAVRREGRAAIAPMIGTAAIVLAPLVIWSVTHPERYGQLIDAYQLYGSSGTSAMVPVTPDAPTGLRLWVGLTWQVFSPDFLFVSGDSSLVNSTRQAGLFPLAFAILMPIGAWAALRSRDVLERIVLIAFVTAPLASVVSGSIQMNRLMFLIPFGVLTAALGTIALLRRGGFARIAALALLLSVPLQFASFRRHYVSEYPVQAGAWFGGNVRDAVRAAADGNGTVYVSTDIPFAQRYWSFYAPEDRQGSVEFARSAPAGAAAGSRLVCAAAGASCAAMTSQSDWRLVASINDPSGDTSFQVFERQ